MRAAVLRTPGALRIEELRDPQPGPGEVLVRAAACGLCHSDLHVIKGESPARLPVVPGHELAGTVIAHGGGVEGPPVGTRVAVPFILPCGHCAQCAAGRDDFCEPFWSLNRAQGTLYDGTTRLYGLDGEPIWMAGPSALAELVAVPATCVFPVPDAIPLEEAAPLGCAAFTAYGAIRHAGALQPGERVAVVAVGGVGANLVQLAATLGAAQVIAIDVSPDKLDLARRMGATHTIDGAREDVAARVAELTDGQGVELAFEALGRPATIRQALSLLGLGGRAVVIGVAPAGALTEVDTNLLVRRQLRLVGSYGARSRADMPELLELAAAGRLRVADAISRRIGLDDAPEAFAALDRGEVVGRAVVRF
jgi:S-(hydroxymethyl)glutathione dehydrogenase/alcohol dehydrogenase